MKPVRVIPDTKYPNMYRLEWKDHTTSVDFYNLSRAKDILKNYDSYIEAMKHSERMKGNTNRIKRLAG